MRALTFLLLLGALGSLNAKSAYGQIVPGAPTTDWNRERQEFTADVLRAYDKLMTDWRAAWEKGDVKAVMDFYQPDAMLFVGDTVPMQGRDNIQKQLARMIPTTVELRTGLSDFVASERLAYALGPFYLEVQESAGSAIKTVTGTVVTILVREGKRWKIRSQIMRPQAPTEEP